MPSKRPTSKVFHVVTPVWGREFLDVFLTVCIPNQLSAGNVPALPNGSRYRILTRSIHVEELERHPAVHALRQVIPVDVIVVDEIDSLMNNGNFYDPLMACHRRAIVDILVCDSAIIFLGADFVLSANALAAIVHQHRQGYRAVMSTALRLTKETFLEVLRKSSTPPLEALSSRELVRMGLPHLHPQTLSMFADAPVFTDLPYGVYWPIGEGGLVARCLLLQPLMVDPAYPVSLRGMIDDHYVVEACRDLSRVHVVTDSDELHLFELTASSRPSTTTQHSGASAWDVAWFAADCDSLQLRNWRERPVYIHAGDLNGGWEVPSATAEAFAREVMAMRPRALLQRLWEPWFLRDHVVRHAYRYSVTRWGVELLKAWRRRWRIAVG